MHIGLIGGIGPAATERYYRGLVDRHDRAGVPLELTLVHAEMRELARNLAAQARNEQAQIFVALVRRLAAAGAQIAAVTSLAGHFCIRELEAISPLPLLDAIPEIDAVIRQRRVKTVGLLGTRLAMETKLYRGIGSAEVVIPEADALDGIHQTYIEMASAGRVTDAQRQVFFTAGKRLHTMRGAEAVLLGGTDLFLAFEGRDCRFPVIDCCGVHIDALHRYAASTDIPPPGSTTTPLQHE